MRNVSVRIVAKSKHTFYVQSFCKKSCHLWDNVEKYWTAEQATVDNMHAGYLRIQIHAQIMQYLLHYHCYSGSTNSSQSYVIWTLPALVNCIVGASLDKEKRKALKGSVIAALLQKPQILQMWQPFCLHVQITLRGSITDLFSCRCTANLICQEHSSSIFLVSTLYILAGTDWVLYHSRVWYGLHPRKYLHSFLTLAVDVDVASRPGRIALGKELSATAE
jgi:hypothetical protein